MFLVVKVFETDGTPAEKTVFIIETTKRNNELFQELFRMQEKMTLTVPRGAAFHSAETVLVEPPKALFGLRMLPAGMTCDDLFDCVQESGNDVLFLDKSLQWTDEEAALVFFPKTSIRVVPGMLQIKSSLQQVDYETAFVPKSILALWPKGSS